nr:retrovirus-related Pol polyprotein from transposon TNT 1-94 [Tanacetum cinerariifolium]
LKCIKNDLFQPKTADGDAKPEFQWTPEINVGFVNSLPEKWLTFPQGLRNANHTQTLDLVDIYGKFVYEDNLIQKRYFDTKKALITTSSSSAIATPFFSINVIQDFQENSNDEVDERSSEEYLRDLDVEYQERNLLANSKHFIKRRNNFSDYKAKYKKMKAKLALLEASPSSPQNLKTLQPKNKGLVAEIFDWYEEEDSDDEEVTQVKVNTLLSMDEDADWKNYLKDELLNLKQAKLDAVTFQIQNTKLTKLNNALQEQLKEEKKINEKWLTSSKKVSQCISEQIPWQKKKVLGDWVERLNPDNKLPNFNTRRILVPESQAVNESLETLNTLESSKDFEAEFLTPCRC